MIVGHECPCSLYDTHGAWHRVHAMTEIRELRLAVGLLQREFADLMRVPVNTFRMWDSGLRPVPPQFLQRAKTVVADRTRETELLPLVRLARELGVHLRTLQAAARIGRLTVEFSSKSVFGRPMRFATRAACERFMDTHYRRFAGQPMCPSPLPEIPDDYEQQLRTLRRRLGLTQDGLARRIGAAGKAVVYQWESRKRRPSPVLWQRVLRLERGDAPSAEASAAERTSS
jgi:DNA-binding transcriptional regulator YiaG